MRANILDKVILRAVIRISGEPFQALSYHKDENIIGVTVWEL